MYYDITSKFISGRGKKAIYKFYEKQEATRLVVLKSLPQELPDIKKGDFLIKVTDQIGNEEIHIWEFKTKWNPRDVENLMVYTLRARQTYNLPVKPVMFLFLPSESASGHYEDDQFQFEFELIKMWEVDGSSILDTEDFYLYPFLPLMAGEENILWDAEEKLYNSELKHEEKIDLLTAMTIFAGLRDQKISQRLYQRRRDIMFESYAYELFREDAIKNVGEEYKMKGLMEGLEKGRMEGLKDAIQLGLELKFGEDGLSLFPQIQSIDSFKKLEAIKSHLRTAKELDEIKSFL